MLSITLTWLLFAALQACETAGTVDSPDKKFFIKYFGADGDQTAVDLLVNEDGTIMLLGNSVSDITTEDHMYLVKVDQSGNVIWEKKFGTPQDRAKDIESTGNGKCIILADHMTTDINTDIKLMRITTDGVLTDSVVYGTADNENSATITALADNGFIVTGSLDFVDENKPDKSDIFHARCDASLVFDVDLWQTQYGPGTRDDGTKVFQYAADEFYVFGSTNVKHDSVNNGNISLVYYPIDGFGRNGSPNYLGSASKNTVSSYVMKVPAALGNGYLVVSTEESSDPKMHVSKLRPDLQFNTENDRQFDKVVDIASRRLTAIAAAPIVTGSQGYLLIANEARETGRNIWLTKIDQNGNQLWFNSYGSEEDDDFGAAVVELSDGRLLVAGSVRLVNNQYKMVLMKLNSKGLLTD
jgi:hypothetical protein